MKLTRKSAIVVASIVAYFFVVHTFFDEYRVLDKVWKDFITVLGFSIFGIFFVFMKKIALVQNYFDMSSILNFLGLYFPSKREFPTTVAELIAMAPAARNGR